MLPNLSVFCVSPAQFLSETHHNATINADRALAEQIVRRHNAISSIAYKGSQPTEFEVAQEAALSVLKQRMRTHHVLPLQDVARLRQTSKQHQDAALCGLTGRPNDHCVVWRSGAFEGRGVWRLELDLHTKARLRASLLCILHELTRVHSESQQMIEKRMGGRDLTVTVLYTSRELEQEEYGMLRCVFKLVASLRFQNSLTFDAFARNGTLNNVEFLEFHQPIAIDLVRARVRRQVLPRLRAVWISPTQERHEEICALLSSRGIACDRTWPR